MALTNVLADTVISGELLAQLPDPGPCELVEGRIVQMSPTGPLHGKLELRLGRALDDFVQAHALGEVYVGEVGIYTKRNPDTVRGADVAFISHERLPQHDPGAAYLTVAPEIVIEILSPSDRMQAIETKVREYIQAGAHEVWIVDPENRTLRRHKSEPAGSEFLEETDTLATSLLPGFELPIRQLFAV